MLSITRTQLVKKTDIFFTFWMTPGFPSCLRPEMHSGCRKFMRDESNAEISGRRHVARPAAQPSHRISSADQGSGSREFWRAPFAVALRIAVEAQPVRNDIRCASHR